MMKRGLVLATMLLHAMVWSAVASSWPADAEAQTPEAGRPMVGALAGAGIGLAAGFGLASATDYELQEGGFFVVALLGGGLGALTGHKLSVSVGRPWRNPRPVQVTLPWALGWSDTRDDVQGAFAASGYDARATHHSLVPAVTLTVDAFGPIRIGAELSGIRAVRVRGEDQVTRLTESVEGESLSFFALASSTPSGDRRLTFFGGGGVNRQAVTVLSYFDQKVMSSLPPDIAQPDRNARVRTAKWSAQARGGIEYYLTDEVSLRLEAVRRWSGAVSVPRIELTDQDGAVVARHVAHSVALRSFHASFGFGMRY